ncbi:MAG: family 43 glycosylhydrolase [Oscillospiraceae bacterium]|nr:family 43 glycosylhydrolase [Oscillospiraceae bacterium]
MANPFLPLWEYIPDGEPRVFGDRVYIYGSHDRAACEFFCDYRLMVWSAPVNDLTNWSCHGISFCTRGENGREPDTAEWTDSELYAPDVVEKDGKYYLYAYIVGSKGCVGVSDHPEGPFTLLGRYRYEEADGGDEGVFNDPGVLVDDDGSAYIYYGFERSHFNALEPDMITVKKGSYKADLIPRGSAPDDFFEASSPRKINGKYYLIYSPRICCCQNYAIAYRPEGPFVRKGTIINNSRDYPGGNDHGSLCCINGQWYIFYHRMTNGTITSRRACVERVEILPDGTIPEVEMTSLGFETALNPYRITPAEIACVLKGGCMITEKDVFTRCIMAIHKGAVIGYKYFDFGDDFTGDGMTFAAQVTGSGCKAEIHIRLDDEDGEEIGVCMIDTHDGTYQTRVKPVTGRHSVYFVMDHAYHGWASQAFDQRQLFDLQAFVFMK